MSFTLNQFIPLIQTVGVPCALLFFFVWRDSKREQAMAIKINVVEEYQRTTLVSLVRENQILMVTCIKVMETCKTHHGGELKEHHNSVTSFQSEVEKHHENSEASMRRNFQTFEEYMKRLDTVLHENQQLLQTIKSDLASLDTKIDRPRRGVDS